MRIVTSYHGGLSERLKRFNISGNRILLLAVYLSGLLLGCSVFLISDTIRQSAVRLLDINESLSFGSLSIVSTVCSLVAGVIVFGAGLSVVGQPCICLTPFVLGCVLGISTLSRYGRGDDFSLLQQIILAPLIGAAVCGILQMCEYALEMTTELRFYRRGRESGEEKKYPLRIILLTLSVLSVNVICSAIIVMMRHFS